jgi:adenosylhomocysteine nucleosidase
MTTVVVQVAMAEEARPFLALADEVSQPVAIAGAEHHGLVFGGRTVVLVRSGIGMVNAADAAAGALHRYGGEALLISAGSAGGVGADARVGEVFVGSEYINVEADARAFGYVAGQVPGMPASYAPDALALAALTASAPEDVTVRLGGIGSGEKFVTAELAHGLRETFPSLHAVDMESAAIAQLARNHGARFISVRAISDLCAPDGTEFETHIDDAADRSARVVVAALPSL